MKLTPEQVEAVRTLAASGASISDIQTALANDFNLHLNYLDTRFLLLDLDVTIAERNPPKPAAQQPAPDSPLPEPDAFSDAAKQDDFEPTPPSALPAEDEPLPPADEPPAPVGGSVQVEISRIQRPGYALSGSLVCSDGVKGEWGVLNDGRLALDFGENKTYRPSPEDIQAFQRQLRDLLSSAY